MALTTHEKIRVEAGFQRRYTREAFQVNPDGSASTFFVTSNDRIKLVPEFSTGTTVAGISDVQVFVGLSGIQGSSIMGVSAVDVDLGSVTLDKVPDSGASLTITYTSSPISSKDVEEVRLRAESTVNQRLSLCYDLPLSPTPSHITRLATELSAALLLIRNYGSVSRDTAADGYALYERLMGSNQTTVGRRAEDLEVIQVGEIGMICSVDYQLVDDTGTIIARNDIDSNKAGQAYKTGGRVTGRIYDITEEPFRYKDFQTDVNREQAGTGFSAQPRIQG